MKVYRIYDKNNDNQYIGFVIGKNEEVCKQKVIDKHPHFTESESEIVWKKNIGNLRKKRFGLEETTLKPQDMNKKSNVIN